MPSTHAYIVGAFGVIIALLSYTHAINVRVIIVGAGLVAHGTHSFFEREQKTTMAI